MTTRGDQLPTSRMEDGLCILRAAREMPARPCVVTPNRTLSFQQVARDSVRVWTQLAQRGVAWGQTPPVAFRARGDYASLCTFYALWLAGVPAMPLHERWTDRERDAALAPGRDTPMCAREVDGISGLEPVDAAMDAISSSHQAWGDVTERLAAVVFTSGSSGPPRGRYLRRAAFIASAAGHADNVGWREADRWLLNLPLAHVGGLSILTRCLLARRPVVLPQSSALPDQLSRTADDLRDLMDKCQVTIVSLVPTQLSRLLETRNSTSGTNQSCPESLRLVLVGGAAAPDALVAEARRRGWPVALCYGSTETCSQVAAQNPERKETQQGVGRVLSHAQVRIDAGSVLVRSAANYAGTYPEAPVSVEWLQTNDLGYFDASGNLHIRGRADDVIISGGENVHPSEVENVLRRHPLVAEACVVGVPDEHWGQAVVAVVVLREAVDTRHLREHCRAELATFKVPRRVHVVEHLPQSSTGKVHRSAVREMLDGDPFLEGTQRPAGVPPS